MCQGKNKKALFVINPRAGNSNTKKLDRWLNYHRDDFDSVYISGEEDIRSKIRSKINDYRIFIAAGGDGTANSLASELIGTGKILGILPFGSGNGFAREMGFRKNVNDLLKDIERNQTIDSDVLYINNKPCINVTGLGTDSFVAHEFHNLDKRGFWKYVSTTIRIAWNLKPVKVSLIVGNEAFDEDVYMLTIANTRQFGNNAIIAPEAVPNDGKYNIALVKAFPKYLFPLFAVKLLTGTLRESKYIKYFETGKPVRIKTAENRFHIDGEPLVIRDNVEIKIKSKALKILKTSRNRWG